jgi:PAS domain S-box-containing protein
MTPASTSLRPKPKDSSDSIFVGPGEMCELCRNYDWSLSSLGPVDTWPQSLRTSVGIVLQNRNPMFLWWGPDLVQFYNDAYRVSLGEGGRHPRALGMKGADFWVEIWTAIGPQIEQVMNGGEATWHEDQYLPIERNGRLEDVWWTYSYSPVPDEHGGIGGVLVTCQETTRRVLMERDRERMLQDTERAELRAARIIQQISDEHLTMDSNFRILSVNLAAERSLGRPRDAIVGLTHWEAFPGSVGTIVEKNYRRVVDERIDIHFKHHYVGEGYDRHLEIDAYSTDEGGVALFWRDVSERVKSETALRDSETRHRELLSEAESARAEAEAANRGKAEFLAVMSHELRTPLNAIGGYAELMEMGIRGPVTPEQTEDLRRIQNSQRHLLGLINEVLNYARLETGTVHYDLQDVRVRDVLAAAEALVLPQAAAKKLSLSVTECPPDLKAKADTEKFRQVVVNLLSNAVKFTDAGGAISVSCAEGSDSITVRVRDTGIGIDADKLDAIFDPFVQVRSDLTRPHEGTGLGLAISRDLARGMGGDLTVESGPGVGSTFVLSLPPV